MKPAPIRNNASTIVDLTLGRFLLMANRISRPICWLAWGSAPTDVGGVNSSEGCVASRTPIRRCSCSPDSKLQAVLVLGIVLLAHSAPAQPWQTVDDFQYVAGQPALNYGLTVAPSGTLFACGYAADSVGTYHGLVMSSTSAGTIWSAPLDDYLYAQDYDTFYDGGMVTDGSGNLYVAGETYYVGSNPLGDLANHWITRRSSDGGTTWSLVDDFAPGGPQTQPFGLASDTAGNVYVAGVANHPGVNDLVWTVRKGTGGGSFSTVDALSSGQGGQANGIYVHPTAGIFAVGSAIIAGTKGYKTTEAWIVRRGSNGGATWSTVDTFQLSVNLTSRAFGIGADSSGNLYVVGQGFIKNGKNNYSHWIVRKSTNSGSSWSTVDDFQLSATSNTGAGRFVADSLGNLYVSGGTPFNPWSANEWLVRKCTGGTGSWQTVDDFNYMGGQALPFAMAANSLGNVFVGGVGSGSTGTHWLVRKK